MNFFDKTIPVSERIWVKSRKYKTLEEWAEARRQYHRDYYLRHKGKLLVYQKEYHKRNYKSHPRRYYKIVRTPMGTVLWE